MRIVIDMQGAQSHGSRNRGIGRYTLWLAQAMARNRGAHEIILALNGGFPETLTGMHHAFAGLLPSENIQVWYPADQADRNWRKKSEQARERFLAALQPDLILISSLFEGVDDCAVTSIKAENPHMLTASILYDLIPYIHADQYLTIPEVASWYNSKLAHMRRADLVLAISESSRREGLQYLGLPADDCISISGAINPQFHARPIKMDDERGFRQRHGLTQPFIMYLAGPDPRKNVDGLIRGYAKLPRALRADHQLAIVCAIQPTAREAMQRLANECGLNGNEVVFTGYVSDDDLIMAYNLCKLFVFPSWHEGFGLPALEAMTCGCAVIGANITSLPEVIGCKDALFDPYSPQSIAEKMQQVLTDKDFRARLQQHGLERSKQFSWDISARKALAAIVEKYMLKKATVRPSSGAILPNQELAC